MIAQQKYGQKTMLDVLNAKVDANSDSITLMNLTVSLQNNIRNLNFLLGREINTEFEVENGETTTNYKLISATIPDIQIEFDDRR